MRMIIEARIVGHSGSNATVCLAEVERSDGDLRQLGLNLSEGRDLIREVQRVLVNAQATTLVEASTHCPRCRAALSIKARHTVQYRTVFGKVTIDSPQLRGCRCTESTNAASFSPLAKAMPFRVSPELEYLQVKWAAHLPFAVATELLKEILPLDQAISTAGLKNRVRAVGQELDDQVESTIRGERENPSEMKNNTKITALAVDSAWLRHCAQPSFLGRHVNVVAGRAVHDDGTSRLYGYVNKEVSSAPLPRAIAVYIPLVHAPDSFLLPRALARCTARSESHRSPARTPGWGSKSGISTRGRSSCGSPSCTSLHRTSFRGK